MEEVPRADLEKGDLFFTPYFKPLWKSYSLASMDASCWTDPDNTTKEEAEYQKQKSKKLDMTMLSLEMRKARKEHAESLGFKGFFLALVQPDISFDMILETVYNLLI